VNRCSGSFIWDPSISLPEILFCIQQLLAHPNHRGSTIGGLYDPVDYRASILRQAQKYDRNCAEFLERAMVELQSKIDPDYKMPLESWENERWENLEEVRWKGRRSFQPRHEPHLLRQRPGSGNVLATMAPTGSLEEEGVQFIMATNSSASPSAGTSNDDEGSLRFSFQAPNANANTNANANANANTDLISPPITTEASRLRDVDGNVCECSCCKHGSRSFVDRKHRMRYLFGEGG